MAMELERFVLSAHGSADAKENFTFTIPDNVILCTYDKLDTCTNYGTSDPNYICIGKFTKPVVERFGGRQLFPNFLLWSDGGKETNRSQYVPPEFYSGVKRCSDNAIVINIDRMQVIVNLEKQWRYKTTLEHVVNEVSTHYVRPGTVAEIHLLICLGQVHDSTMTTMLTEKMMGMKMKGVGGRRRKSRKMQQRKKNRSSKSKSKSTSKHNRRHKSRH
jgi:hypothetical protein